ncbi:hypothetical protein F2Q69_00008828 [Brassica cretica]|uniref:Uncharacterized protein n=1 Tax=Brassica cretica TaxID=69181 RepID=A0A8S9P6Q5_BRACR|nr:hypothetical protein F2Q69_00008828 [Brassica cretica]
MDYLQVLLASLFLFFSTKFLFTKSKPKPNLPPSLRNSLPVIGHLHPMKRPFHRKLLSFSRSLGNAPIIHLRLGQRQTYGDDAEILRYSLALQVYTTPAQHLDYSWSSPLTTTSASATTSGQTSYVFTKFARHLVSEAMAGDSGRNPADYLSFLRWFTDSEARIKDVAHRFDGFLQKLVDEKHVIIKGIILDLIIAGTDTVAITLEWALSNLLNHQGILKKAIIEIDDKIGLDRRLPKVGGYDMPRGTMLVMNVWAIHRDPELWEEPQRFKPERFDKEGEAQKVMPFGLGRRSCPGAGLAHRLMGLTLASLVQCFEWERVSIEQIDVREGKGVTMPKKEPLRAM